MSRRAFEVGAWIVCFSLPAGAGEEKSAVGGSLGGEVDTSDGARADAETADAASSSSSERGLESGFEHGLRLGVSLPFGKTGDANLLRSGELNGIVGVRIPVWLDLGYRIDRTFWIGIAPELGLGSVGGDCEDDQECEWTDLRLSAQAIWQLSPSSSTDPWLGVGLGWESLRGSVTLTAVDPDSEREVAFRLRELLQGPQASLQGGMRFDIGEALTVGPYVAASAGMFLFDGFDCPSGVTCPTDSDVETKQVHAWLGLGVRGTHGP